MRARPVAFLSWVFVRPFDPRLSCSSKASKTLAVANSMRSEAVKSDAGESAFSVTAVRYHTNSPWRLLDSKIFFLSIFRRFSRAVFRACWQICAAVASSISPCRKIYCIPIALLRKGYRLLQQHQPRMREKRMKSHSLGKSP
jgi:hypothetical protein